MECKIRPITDEAELYIFLEIIKKSFITVAEQFSLTSENAPTNPAYISWEKLKELYKKSECYGVFAENKPSGFFIHEFSPDGTVLFLEKVSVLPEMRHKGYGNRILEHTVKSASLKKCNKISIGIINENTIFKKWCIDFGFKEISIKNFEHLPFQVCFLDYIIKQFENKE